METKLNHLTKRYGQKSALSDFSDSFHKNRNEEYKALVKELHDLPVPDGSTSKALQRLQMKLEEEKNKSKASNH